MLCFIIWFLKSIPSIVPIVSIVIFLIVAFSISSTASRLALARVFEIVSFHSSRSEIINLTFYWVFKCLICLHNLFELILGKISVTFYLCIRSFILIRMHFFYEFKVCKFNLLLCGSSFNSKNLVAGLLSFGKEGKPKERCP